MTMIVSILSGISATAGILCTKKFIYIYNFLDKLESANIKNNKKYVYTCGNIVSKHPFNKLINDKNNKLIAYKTIKSNFHGRFEGYVIPYYVSKTNIVNDIKINNFNIYPSTLDNINYLSHLDIKIQNNNNNSYIKKEDLYGIKNNSFYCVMGQKVENAILPYKNLPFIVKHTNFYEYKNRQKTYLISSSILTLLSSGVFIYSFFLI